MYLVIIEIMQSIQLFSKANVTQIFFFWGRNVLLNFEQCKGPWHKKKKNIYIYIYICMFVFFYIYNG